MDGIVCYQPESNMGTIRQRKVEMVSAQDLYSSTKSIYLSDEDLDQIAG